MVIERGSANRERVDVMKVKGHQADIDNQREGAQTERD